MEPKMPQGPQGPQGQRMQGAGAGGASQEELARLLQQVVELLKQGMKPEALVAKGVPAELIDEAMRIVMAQEAGGGATNMGVPPEQEGLAGSQIARKSGM